MEKESKKEWIDVYICVCVYIYIYIERERERESIHPAVHLKLT